MEQDPQKSTGRFNYLQNLSRPKRWALALSGCALLVILILLVSVFYGLPSAEEIKAFQPESTVAPTEIETNQPPERPIRVWTPLERISSLLQMAVIVSEDDTFYRHDGVNFEMMKEAFKVNLDRKKYARGASTITMQLARNAFLHKRKTLLRKIREIIVAKRIEKYLSKERILELYLNLVEWGHNIYGAEAAARYYFGRPAANLNLDQASMLAGMLPNPKFFNPFVRPESCKRMQKRVLWLMQISRMITKEEAAIAGGDTTLIEVTADDTTATDSLQIFDSDSTQSITPPLLFPVSN